MGLKRGGLGWACIFLVLLITGCAWKQAIIKPREEPSFLQKTSRLEQAAREDPNPSVRAQSRLQLGFLYLSSKNPQLSYTRALQEFEGYLSLAPANPNSEEFQNWLAALREMERVRAEGVKNGQTLKTQLNKTQETNKALREEAATLKKAHETLREEAVSLKEANKTLREEVNSLKDTIEKLKTLDLQMEEKRHQLR
jgi:chromosome segregation ATPase